MTNTPSLAKALDFVAPIVGPLSSSDTAAFVTGFIGEAIRVKYPDRKDIADYVDSIQ